LTSKYLHELKPGEEGKIVKVAGGGAIHRRLLDMGLVSGSDVEVERVAPLGDPIEIKIKGYHLSLRKEEASNIQVEVK
jgi:Fe2+ transport system protein FeoA